MLTGVSFSRVMQKSFFERYTRLLMETSPEIPIYFLRIYSHSDPGGPGGPSEGGSVVGRLCPGRSHHAAAGVSGGVLFLGHTRGGRTRPASGQRNAALGFCIQGDRRTTADAVDAHR